MVILNLYSPSVAVSNDESKLSLLKLIVAFKVYKDQLEDKWISTNQSNAFQSSVDVGIMYQAMVLFD